LTYRKPSKKWGVCPITSKLDKYTPGNWRTECIDCDECPNRCPESRRPDGFENENGRYHGGAVFAKDGYSIFKHPIVLEMKEKAREKQRGKYRTVHNPNPIPSVNTLELYTSIAVYNLREALVSSGMEETNDYIVSIGQLLEFTTNNLGFVRGD